MHFDIETLKLFALVVEYGSISAASEPGNMVPSAISRRLAELEESAGVPLLRRLSRGVEPTPAGRSLYEHIKTVMAQLHKIECDISEYREGVQGKVRICVNMTALCYYLPATLKPFMSQYPAVQIELTEQLSDDIPGAVASGLADLGVCAPTKTVVGVSEAFFRNDPLVLITPLNHPLAKRKRVRFEDTLNENHVMMQEGASTNRLSVRAASAANQHIHATVRVTSFEAMRNMVSEGLGVAVVPEIALRGADSSRYSCVGLVDQWCNREFKILWNSNVSQSTAVMRLLRHLRSQG